MQPPSHSYPCPQCGARMQTRDSRPAKYLGSPSIRRRRVCTKCLHRTTTYEVGEPALKHLGLRFGPAILALRRANETLTRVISEYDGEEHDVA